MVETLLLVGLAVAVFVGFNIGGSSTGVAFGPAVGSGVVSKLTAAALMTVFALLGGWTVGREVIETMGGEIVPASLFSPTVSIAVLFFIGVSLLLSNVVGVPASTSMTAVGSIAGLGLATGRLNAEVMLEIVGWWVVSPVVAFWLSGVIGRYFYPYLVEWFAVTRSDGALLALDRSGTLPRPTLGPGTTRREFLGTALVVIIACYMAFSAGASNVANAVAPLVGNGSISASEGVLVGAAAIGVGAFTIARRTLDTMGNDLTEMPLLAALVVATVSASVVTFLSALGIPASFVVIATMSIVGLGWGRATRTSTITQTARGEGPRMSVGALAADAEDVPTVGDRDAGASPDEHNPRPRPAPIGDEEPEDIPRADDLFEPTATARVILLQNVVPVIATVASYLLFAYGGVV
ncbi:inorganic phosphate transporter [Halorarum salinum]|uniref:Phosphate transporter n=1 Tax=Halorarum salinum TaxID=2743089 RepID=A0A7D5L8W1_9EURY|nr:inorganic phosphate transporter [Halobaculum salinum]QLG60834.1 inorganic phosphate transporter [Halobaculum salinum]